MEYVVLVFLAVVETTGILTVILVLTVDTRDLENGDLCYGTGVSRTLFGSIPSGHVLYHDLVVCTSSIGKYMMKYLVDIS
jgi:hypothetical protein